jgi:ankyrin repeat protein
VKIKKLNIMASFTVTEENVWVASSDGDVKRVEELLTSGVSVNAQDEHGYSPLHAAVSYGHADLITMLLIKGATIDIRDEEGDTPLLVCEKPEILELLVENGADISVRNAEGEGIVEKCVQDENETMCEYLVDKGITTPEAVMELRRKYFPETFIDFDNQDVIDLVKHLEEEQARLETEAGTSKGADAVDDHNVDTEMSSAS